MASCCARNRNAGNERDKMPPLPKIDVSVASVEALSPSVRASALAAVSCEVASSVSTSALFLVTAGLRRGRRFFLDDRDDLADAVDAYPKIVVGLGDAGLVFVVRFAGFPFPFDESVEPKFLQAAKALGGLRGDRCFAERGLIRACEI